MDHATFTTGDLETFCRLDELGLTATGQRIEQERSVLHCRVREVEDEGVPRGTLTGQLAHVPLGWRPTMLLVRTRRYRCPDCGLVWRQNTTAASEPRTKLSRYAALWALRAIVIDRLSITRVAAGLAVSWNTANDAVLAAGHRLLINDPTRFAGVEVTGVDEHLWSHTGHGPKYLTVVIDLTPIRAGTGPSRLLEMILGRSKQVFKT